MKALRNDVGYRPEDRISVMVTGEYGDKKKRPHWHAILFNFRPGDEKSLRTTGRDEQVFHSPWLFDLWGKGNIEYGSVSMDSAGYVARYAAKKLVHGRDDEHDFRPIHHTSSKIPIGRPWIEKNWRHTFENGFVVVNGSKHGIPRYYEDWLKKNRPDEFLRYISDVRPKAQKLALLAREKDDLIFRNNLKESDRHWSPLPQTRNEVKDEIQFHKHEAILKGLKL